MRVILLAALVACGPRYDPKGPGAMPDPVGTEPTTTATPVPSRPAAPPPPPPPADDPPPPAETAPPRASLELAAAKGSTVGGTFAFVQVDDETRVIASVTGLAKNGSYMLSKRDHCATGKADDDSRRSNPVVYGLAIKANAMGIARIDDSAKAIHLDGPMSIVGAYFVVSKTAGSAELACGRVIAQQ